MDSYLSTASVSVRIFIFKYRPALLSEYGKFRLPLFPLVGKRYFPQQLTDLLLNPCCLNQPKKVSDDEADTQEKQLHCKMANVLLITYRGTKSRENFSLL